MFRSYHKVDFRSWCDTPALPRTGFNMSLCVFDKGWGCLLILLSAGILQSTLASLQELPDAPSAVMRTSSSRTRAQPRAICIRLLAA